MAQDCVCAGKIPPNMMLEKRIGIDSITVRVSKEDFQRLLTSILCVIRVNAQNKEHDDSMILYLYSVIIKAKE